MILISILSDQKLFTRNFDDFFPIYKWKNNLFKEGYKIKFYYSHKNISAVKSDIYIISNRCRFENRVEFKAFLKKIKNNTNKVLLFDASDTSGIVDFDLIDYVDAIIKKQVLKNKNLYTENNYDLSVRPWLSKMPENQNYKDYIPCPISSIEKIKLGWNIGLCDYRYFPSYFGLIRNLYIRNLKNNADDILENKNILISFRGSFNYGNNLISFQRNKVLEILKKMNKSNIILGKVIHKLKYLKELKYSKIGISPFGWGEICYRDFELIYNKAILIKPSMDHIETYPNLFVDNETYIKIDWDVTDLENKISYIELNYNDYKRISNNAYQLFMYHQNNYNSFSNHFKNIIKSV
jgi:hypothetical protein